MMIATWRGSRAQSIEARSFSSRLPVLIISAKSANTSYFQLNIEICANRGLILTFSANSVNCTVRSSVLDRGQERSHRRDCDRLRELRAELLVHQFLCDQQLTVCRQSNAP